jgi:thiamine kinase-like enzyme
VQAVVALIAQLHTRAAEHAMLPECRLHGGEFGMRFFTANVQDAIRCLAGLRSPWQQLPPAPAALCERLWHRLEEVSAQRAHCERALVEFGGPETLLHGDLWTTNTFVLPTPQGFQARLIDWDHAAVGPISYDLSTFLLRFRPEDRFWILDLYRDAVARAGWELPDADTLNLLFETAELARFANRIIWPAIAIQHEGAAWGFDSLAEVEQWFSEMQPVLPVKPATPTAREVLS